MSEEEILEMLKTRLRINVKTRSEYTGGMGDGPLYTDHHTLQLLLDDEVINEALL